MSSEQNKSIADSAVRSVGAFPGKDILAAVPKWTIIAILLLTAIIYSRVIVNDFVNIDDDTFITKNPLITNFGWESVKAVFTSFQNGKYQPLVNLSFLLEHTFFGFNPVAFHITNVLLHLASTWIVYKLTEKLSGKQLTAAVVAVLFAVHPMHVEEVAWAAERKDLLYSLFFLLAMLRYLRYIDSGLQLRHLTGVFFFFLASLFSKTTAMTLPLILLTLDVYRGRKLSMRSLIEKVPFFLVAIAFAVVASLSQQAEGVPMNMPESINFINRIFLFTYVPSFYIISLIVPFHLSVMHYYPVVTDGLLPWQYYASFPFLLFVIILVIRLAIKRAPLWKEMVFGAFFFAITISIMEQIISVGPSLTPERYTYIPYLGLFYIIGQWLSGTGPEKQKKAVILLSFFLVFFCVQAWARIGVWKDSDSVFNDSVNKNTGMTNSQEFYFMRGNTKVGQGDFSGAVQDYNQAIALNRNYAEAYTNRAVAYFQAGDMKSALRDLNEAITLNPKRAKPYQDRGAVKATTGDFEGALKDFDIFLNIDSTNQRVYADRAMVRLSLGDTTGGCYDLRKSLKYGNIDAAQMIRQYCR
jgi:protein O-mannosyl-transferase